MSSNVVVLRSASITGGHVDTVEQAMLDGVDGEARTRAIHELRGVQAHAEAFVQRRNEAMASRALTGEGKRDTVARLEAETRTKLAPAKAVSDGLGADIAALRELALQGCVRDARGRYGFVQVKAPARSTEDFLLEREVRDRLHARYSRTENGVATIDHLVTDGVYLEAVRSGRDPVLVRAIEGAPASFALVSDQARRDADAIKIARSPAAEEIQTLERLKSAYDFVLGGADHEIKQAIEATT